MLIWMLNGWLVILVIATVLVLPLCVLAPVEEVRELSLRLIFLLGWYWYVAGPLTRWTTGLLQRVLPGRRAVPRQMPMNLLQ